MAAIESIPLRVRLLGEMKVSIGEETAAFPTRKAASLCAVLLMNHGRAVSRERLASVLWPDDDEVRARHNLSTALWRLRQAVGTVASSIAVTENGIKIAHPEVDVDLFRFRDIMSRIPSAHGQELKQLLELAEETYSGDLAETLSEDWFEEERMALRLAYTGVLRELAAIHIESAEYDSGIAKLQILSGLDPLDEDTHRELMRAYYLAGKREAALSQYESLRRLLLSELGTKPTLPTIHLHEHIRNSYKWGLPQMTRGDATGIASPEFLNDAPIVGRGRELARLTGRLDSALASRGSAAIVCGDLGIGKTRLMHALIEEARLRGFEVLNGACPDLEAAPPYQVFLQALWPRIRKRSILTDRVGAVVDHLVESVSLGGAVSEQGVGPILGADSSILNEYMLNLLYDAQSQWPPTLLVVEDIHRIDSATEGLLVTLLSRLPALRVFVMLSLRRGEAESDRVRMAVLAAGGEVIDLEPLDRNEIPRLLEGALGHVVPLAPLAEFVYQHTGGVPLFVIELLKFLIGERYLRRRLDGGYAFDERALRIHNLRVPSRVLEVVKKRIARLERDARMLLSIAAVIGSEVPVELLERLLGVPEDRFIETVESLLDCRLLVEGDTSFKFPHESVRTAALSLLSGTRRRQLHAKTAVLLESLAPAKVGEIAWHYGQAGVVGKAAFFFEAAGDRAKQIWANEDAVRYYSQAIASTQVAKDSDPSVNKYLARLLLKRQEVLDLIGDRAAQAVDIDTILNIAGNLHDQELLGHGLLLRSQVLSRMNKNSEALEFSSQAERLFRTVGDAHGAARAAEAMGLAYVNLRNQRRAKSAFSRSLALFERVQDRTGQARALANLGTAMALAGDNTGSIRCLDQAEEILRELSSTRGLAGVLLQKGVLYRYLGRGGRSEALLASGTGLMREIGDKVGEARGRSQLACTKASMGKLREGLREAITAIRLAREANDVRAQIVFMNNAAYYNLRGLGQFRRAEAYVNRAMRIVADGTKPENAAIYYDTVAAILLEKGDNKGALRWGRQALALYRRWQGHFDYVGDDITFHIGLAHLRLGNLGRALPHLQQSVANWRRRADLGQLVHGVAALGELYQADGQLPNALGCAREVEKLLRQIDGAEQVQRVYWTQYRIYAASGARAAARRALAKAVAAVVAQAATLKGRLRLQFLRGITVNREILAMAERDGFVLESLPTLVGPNPRPDPAVRIDQRRRAILALMSKGRLDRKRLADQFGVSTRTIRNDLAILRQETSLTTEL